MPINNIDKCDVRPEFTIHLFERIYIGSNNNEEKDNYLGSEDRQNQTLVESSSQNG